MLCGLGAALRCQCIMLTTSHGIVIHVFGYASDIERLDLLYTSLLLQMSHALVRVELPERCASPRAYRRSWLLGFTQAAIGKVKAAEAAAVKTSDAGQAATGSTSAALVLADRSLVIKSRVTAEYPKTRSVKLTYTGSGYGAGYAKGQQANIGGTSVRNRAAGALR
jgi:hypothetical protein